MFEFRQPKSGGRWYVSGVLRQPGRNLQDLVLPFARMLLGTRSTMLCVVIVQEGRGMQPFLARQSVPSLTKAGQLNLVMPSAVEKIVCS